MEEWLNQYWWLFIVLVLWELAWKGFALWHAVQKKDKAWFWVLLIFNTMGILPILYLTVFSKRNDS
jgi:hypothetical protein